MKKSVTNLQPWLDYFKMLQSYEQKGYLDVMPDKGEAYVTMSALLKLTGTEETPEAIQAFMQYAATVSRAFGAVLRHLRAYAGWKSQQGKDFLTKPFAMNVVDDEHLHDPLFTMLLTSRRKWWRLWTMSDHIDVITYNEERKQP